MNRILVLVFGLLFFCSTSLAQVAAYSESAGYQPRELLSEDSKKKKKSKQDAKKTEPTEIVKEDSAASADEKTLLPGTKLIKVPISVFDAEGKFVRDLSQTDFTIFVDGEIQPISVFEAKTEALNLILLIDTSPSMAFKIEEIREYASAIVKQLRPQDKVMIIEFDSSINVLTELTDDPKKISKAIRKADFGDGTALYDTMENLFRKQIASIEGRKAIVLMTDGVDTTSMNAKYESSLEEAEKHDIPIFPVYFDTFEKVANPTFRSVGSVSGLPMVNFPRQSSEQMKVMYERGKFYINDLVSLSGGRTISTESLSGKPQKFAENIVEELSLKYYAGFQLSETPLIKRRAQIKVRVNRPNLLVLARGSYFIGN